MASLWRAYQGWIARSPLIAKYGFLGRVIPSSTTGAVIAKMAIDQTVFAPTIIGSFFVGQGFLEGRSAGEVREKFERAFWPTMKANWTLWPLAQLVNFKFIPLPMQALYVNVVSLAWNTYLSLANARHSRALLPPRDIA